MRHERKAKEAVGLEQRDRWHLPDGEVPSHGWQAAPQGSERLLRRAVQQAIFPAAPSGPDASARMRVGSITGAVRRYPSGVFARRNPQAEIRRLAVAPSVTF